MPYTVWSRGRKLGATDLGFLHFIRDSRMGWFAPAAEYEKLMPIATGVQSALHAHASRADLAAAFQQFEALALELRRDDDSIVPTASIGIQDVQELLACDAGTEVLELPREWEDRDDLFLEWTERDSAVLIDECAAERKLDLYGESMADDLEDGSFSRYQIHVQLVDADAIP